MKKVRKNIEKSRKAVEPRPYTLQEAVPLLQKVKFAKFDETVEVTLRLGVDPKHADQMVRGTVVLPHGLGKSKKVLVIASGDKFAKPKRRARISSAAKRWSRRSRKKTGPTSTP
jgi:large subunit ribosomal protein L1